MRKPHSSLPEILAPAGDPLALRAAIAAGADAVYLGMARFNARGRAERFRGVTLSSCVRAAHAHDVRVYVTLNTLLHDDELPLALNLAREARDVGVDAAIVQDLGFARLLRAELPGLPLHGSTQMTIHQPEQAAALVEAGGLKRVIIARECSVAEARSIAAGIRPLGADVEVFVHGALCFAYSGQCLMSNFAGRRSANRGICAQNCRFDFTASAKPTGFRELPLFDRRQASQLISMKDLAAFDTVAALANAGVASFKIEGRLKSPEYVAEVVRLYRAALDAWQRGQAFDARDAEREAGRVFSRGFTNGYLADQRDSSMRGDKRSLEGEPDAVVRTANRHTGLVHLEPRPGHSIRPGQGYRYAHDRYRGGFLVIAAQKLKDGSCEARIRFGAEASGRQHRRGAAGRRRPPPPLPDGLACYLNSDPELVARIDKLVASVAIAAGPDPVSIRLTVSGAPGEPLHVSVVSSDGRTVADSSSTALEVARSRALDEAILTEHLGRLGGTPYRLESIDVTRLAPGAFLTFPCLHALRTKLVAALDKDARPATKPAAARPFHLPPHGTTTRATSLAVCVGSPEALIEAQRSGANRLVIESASLLRDESPGFWKEAAGEADSWLRLPPIVHNADFDEQSLALVQRLGLRGIVAGHMGQVQRARALGLGIATDLFFNAYNVLTLEALRDAGALRATLSLEVEAKEARRVATRAPAGLEVEVVVGGRVFSMLTRQPYGLKQDERLAATSEHGHSYIFEADAGVTTLYEARELVALDVLPFLVGAVDSVRLDLAHHDEAAVGEITAAYRRAIDRLAIDSSELTAENAGALAYARAIHERHARHGSFTGHLIRGARAQDAGEATGDESRLKSVASE